MMESSGPSVTVESRRKSSRNWSDSISLGLITACGIYLIYLSISGKGNEQTWFWGVAGAFGALAGTYHLVHLLRLNVRVTSYEIIRSGMRCTSIPFAETEKILFRVGSVTVYGKAQRLTIRKDLAHYDDICRAILIRVASHPGVEIVGQAEEIERLQWKGDRKNIS